MKKLYIVGAGGFGRELGAWLRHSPECGHAWELTGFLDDDPSALAGVSDALPLVSSITDFQPDPDDLLICGLGQPAVKRRVVQQLRERGAVFIGFTHPSVILGERVRLGEGVVLCPGAILTSDIRLGDFALINCHSSLGHDTVLEDFVTISGHCDLTSRCHIGEEAFLGSGVRLRPGVKVGAAAVVGIGSVVIQAVPPSSTVFGNPAKRA